MKDRIHLLYQLVSPLHRTASDAEVAHRLKILQGWASGSRIDIASPETGPDTVETATDVAMVFPHLREAALGWREQGYDAVIVGCFSDPGVDALREIAGIPVIGPGEAGIHAAAHLAGRFSVLSSEPTPPGLRKRIRGIGLEPMFVSEIMVGCSVAELVASPDENLPTIISNARACVAAGAEALVLGCLAMSFTPNLTARLSEACGVPVINPVIAGVKAAEAAALYPAGTQSRTTGPSRQVQHS